MTRIRERTFVHPAALYRGDGGGIAVIARDRPFDEGSCWARIVSPGAGIDGEFLWLDRRSGGQTDGHVVAEDLVRTISGDEEDAPPPPHRPDSRLQDVGTFFEVEDAGYAREADAASGATLRAANARIAAAAFDVRGVMDGRVWRVRVGPTLRGTTTLECHADDGELRLLRTEADRVVLERATAEPVTVSAVFTERGPGRHRSRTRTIEVALAPDGR